MAPATMKIILSTAIMAAALVIPAASQAGCTTALISLAPCLSYISGNSSTPSSSCCSQLTRVVQSQPRCLCTVLSGGGSSFGISINRTQALALPGACKVQTPPVSQCNAGEGGSAPSPAESPNSANIPAVPSSPSSNPMNIALQPMDRSREMENPLMASWTSPPCPWSSL